MQGKRRIINICNVIRNRQNRFYSDNKHDELECCISGFSKYSSRKDLEIFLGSYQPVVIEPLINDFTLNFTGIYHLSFSKKDEKVALENEIKSRNEYKDVYNTSTFKYIQETNLKSRPTKANYDLSRSSIHKHIPFKFKTNPYHKSPENQFILNFRSPEEAEQAFVEKNLKLILGNETILNHYHC